MVCLKDNKPKITIGRLNPITVAKILAVVNLFKKARKIVKIHIPATNNTEIEADLGMR